MPEKTTRELNAELRKEIGKQVWKRRILKALRLIHLAAVIAGYCQLLNFAGWAVERFREWLSTLF